jgi:hypothetical protein
VSSSVFDEKDLIERPKPTTSNRIPMKTLFTTLAIFFAAVTIQAADKPYPLKKCLVSDNKLGSMGTPVTKVYDGQEIKFCCKPCVKKFEANKAKYLAKLPK